MYLGHQELQNKNGSVISISEAMCVYLHINEVLSLRFSKGYFVYFNISQLTLSAVWPRVWLFLTLVLSLGAEAAPGSERVKSPRWKLCNYTKSGILKQCQDSASRLELIFIFNCEDISVASVFISSLSTVLSVTKLVFTRPALHSSHLFSNWRQNSCSSYVC